MRKKIFIYAFLIGFSVMLISSSIFFVTQYQQTRQETYTALQQEAVYAERGLMLSGQTYLETLGQINRITWIDEKGYVLYDNLYALPIANQLEYDEVREAIQQGEGKSIRQSLTGGQSTMYYAKLCADGTILRLSRPMSDVQSAFEAVSPTLYVFILMLLIAGVLSSRFAKSIVKPINMIDLDHPDANGYVELTPLIERMNDQKVTIQSQINELYMKQKEFTALTDNIHEGFIIIDLKGIIISVNYSALSLIQGIAANKPLMPHLSDPLKQCVLSALHGVRSETRMSIDEGRWEFIANPIMSHDHVSGAVILMMDVTESEQREQLRQAFTANVTHELKTPLTSISGFAELMASGVVEDDKIKEFSNDIYKESQRMINLVNDILRLAQLDEGSSTFTYEHVDLYEVVNDVLNTLDSAINAMDLDVTFTGEHAMVNGIWVILYEMIYNIVDNAIKYNKRHGAIEITITAQVNGIQLSVSDTGIGIPYAQQSFVFERFYRVDKSHSKAIGGTGLGLSIVKHGAMLHEAQLSLTSVPDQGTTITLQFQPLEPINKESS